MHFDHLAKAPFNLDAEALAWARMRRSVVKALLGKIEWNRHSPVDPFCGLEDARY